jgi:hypothetical protein
MTLKLNSLTSLETLYTELLLKYKTVASKKAMLTRDIKAHKEFMAEVAEAIGRTTSDKGWYLGNKYSQHDFTHYKNELKLMEDIRNNIR